MNQYLNKIALSILIAFSAVSCSDFLDVVPQNKILESQIFKDEAGMQNVHNGLYVMLASDELYGRQLTMDAVDILGQQYYMPASHTKTKMASYAYAEANPKGVFTNIWQKAFTTILSANKFLESLDKHNGIVSQEKANLLKGEAIAIRAMLHFSTLR